MTNDQLKPMSRTVRACALASVRPGFVLLAGLVCVQGQTALDPLTIFQPTVSFSPPERARLARGETLVKSVPAADGQVAIFSGVRAAVDGDRLVRWVRRVDAMKRGRYAPAVRRFSDPPRVEDLSTLELDADDLDALRDCRPGDCGLKLSESEMATLAPLARARRPGWQAEVQRAYRDAILARAKHYLASGLAGVPPYRDRETPVRLEDEFRGLVAQSGFLARVPALTDFLSRYPTVRTPEIESFLYWSKEILGRKPVVSITHVTMSRGSGGADAMVVSRQVYASHYMTGSIAVTAIAGEAPRYLLYLNRSRVDVLDGFFGGLARRIVEGRLRDEAGQVVDSLRRRLEAGEPPGES